MAYAPVCDACPSAFHARRQPSSWPVTTNSLSAPPMMHMLRTALGNLNSRGERDKRDNNIKFCEGGHWRQESFHRAYFDGVRHPTSPGNGCAAVSCVPRREQKAHPSTRSGEEASHPLTNVYGWAASGCAPSSRMQPQLRGQGITRGGRVKLTRSSPKERY